MKKKSVRIIAGALVVMMLLGIFAVFPAAADNENETVTQQPGEPVDVLDTGAVPGTDDYDYYAYKNDTASYGLAIESIVKDGSDYASEKDSGVVIENEYQGETNVIVWESQKGSVDYVFDVPEDARYNITFTYKALDSSERDLAFGIMIDGEFPFFEANAMELPRMWVDAGEFRKDDYGNEFAPEQIPYDGFVTKSVYDLSGASVYPMEFALTKGTHTITVVTNSESWVISKIALSVPQSNIKTYAEVKEIYKNNGYAPAKAQPVVIEAEHAFLKSTRSLIPYADNSSSDVTPSNATISKINYIGYTNWKLPNEEITWVLEVPEDGLYKLGFKYKQDQVVNGFSYRHLRIDGVTPFEECANMKFDYSIKWSDYTFGDKNGAYEFYLTKGTHELSLTGTMGELSDSYYELKSVASEIGSLYLEIVMVTGETPDPNVDYELFRTIPEFEPRLKSYYDRLKGLVTKMQTLSGENSGSYIAAINNTARVLKDMIDHRYTAHKHISEFYSQYTTLSSWLYSMQEMSVSVDCIKLVPADQPVKFKKAGFFERIWFAIKRFLVSFSESYSKISVERKGSKSIRIWVNWGRDQSQVLNNLINESFLPYAEEELGYPVSVNLELVNADILKGMLSGNAPDVSLQLARSTPVNLAMRGALVDLKRFEDYEEVMKRFGDTAGVPYQYKGGAYALPDQQSFYMMFYRTDILEKLNLEVPQTWEEFLAVTAVLQRNNMNSSLPYTKVSGSVDTGVGGLNLYCSILMQFGGDVYNEELNRCLLDSPTSLSAFTFWTDMYTKYKVPVEASFYNRFRAGTIPLGVLTYTQYTTLKEAAPEITGRWGMALIPGVEQEDGTIDRTISGSGTGCSILHTCKEENLDLAWTFLKWWTSANTQSRYNTNVESILGTISRITTANLEAFENMTWERNDLELLLEQRKWISEVPEVPGSYYVSRSLDQAYWAVINEVDAPKDALTRWTLEANKEIKRKIAEYA